MIFSGAGMSQESSLPTFRGEDGIWESINPEKVAYYKAWYCGRCPDCKEKRQAVLDFINPIRRQILSLSPNEAHHVAARLEKDFDVTVITQNGDDFHQRAGSTKVIHLHGEALKNASTLHPYIPIALDPENPDIRIGDKAPEGSQIRSYVIFFNENLQYGIWKSAVQAIREADMMIIVGCSLKVSPAAEMVEELREDALLVVIDPADPPFPIKRTYAHLKLPASDDFAREIGRLMMPYLASHPDIGFDSFRKSVRNMIKKVKIYCHCERLTDEHHHHQIIDAINNTCKSIGSKYHDDMLIYVKLGKGQKIHMIQYKNLNLHIIVHHGVKRHNLCIAFDKDIKANPKEDEEFVYVWL